MNYHYIISREQIPTSPLIRIQDPNLHTHYDSSLHHCATSSHTSNALKKHPVKICSIQTFNCTNVSLAALFSFSLVSFITRKETCYCAIHELKIIPWQQSVFPVIQLRTNYNLSSIVHQSTGEQQIILRYADSYGDKTAVRQKDTL